LKRRVKAAVWAVFLSGVAVLLYVVRAVLPPFLFALVIAYLLDPVVTWLESRRVRRTVGILSVYAVLFCITTGSMFFVLPSFVGELVKLGEAIPEYTNRLRGFVDTFQWTYRGAALPGALKVALDETIATMEVRLLRLVRDVLDSVISLFAGVLGVAISPILAFYILRDMRRFKSSISSTIPFNVAGDLADLVTQIDRVIGGFVRGQLLVGLFVAVAVAGVLSLLGVRFSLLLGVLAGLGEFIPYFGPILAAVPALAVALVKSPVLAVEVLVVFAIIQQVDAAVIAPKIMGDRVGLHPLGVIFSVLAGGYLFGVWGMFLAVPAAGIVKAVAGFVYRRYLA